MQYFGLEKKMEAREMIAIRGLTKTFGLKADAVTALRNIDLSRREGEIFGIIGLSGAGKSTLVRCMNYLEHPTEGSVTVDGKKLGALNKTELLNARRGIGMIFQQFNLLMQKTALDNICFPLEIAGVSRKDAIGRARELLKLVDLEDREKAYPAQLSGGQKQRVAIARALAPRPKVLLCDEATSALDPTTTRSILSLLKEINRTLGITIVVITHEMSVIEEICDRVAIIDHSQIAEVGEVSDIFMNPKTEIAKKLLYASGRLGEEVLGERCLRIIFDGTQTSSPVICDMVLECGAPVNILFADTKTIEGKMHGYTLIQLPENRELGDKMKKYLDLHGVQYLEEAYHV